MSNSIEPSNLRTLANPFQFTNQDVRTAVDHNDELWFCAKDVCEILDISWTSHTLDNMPNKWFMVVSYTTIKGKRDTVFINEPGLYHLIFRSNKPKAKEFADWVCSEVLPSIRKNGFFGTITETQRLAYSKQIISLATSLSNTKDAMLVEILVNELRTLCNLAGQPMPKLNLLHQDYKQLEMFKEAQS